MAPSEATAPTRVVTLTNTTLFSIASFHTDKCEQGIICVTGDGQVQMMQLPANTRYDIGWPVRKLRLDTEVNLCAYFEPKDVYVLATTEQVPFRLPEDNNHKEWTDEETNFLPVMSQGYIKLLDPHTWTIIDSLELEQNEICLSMVSANLEVNERKHIHKNTVSLGTIKLLGEDQAAQGRIVVLDVVDVVPEPGRPETKHKLKQYAQEKVKGAVTALAEISNDGFLLVAMGQKLQVRGVNAVGRILPLGFLDVPCYITDAKVFKGTGMIVVSDIAKGMWLIGYTVRWVLSTLLYSQSVGQ